MSIYFNENDRFAAEWLKCLFPLAAVDARSIVDVVGKDLRNATRVHLFGGIGGWEYALWLAGWPQDREVWTGSCPCQPFSEAGARRGTRDDRHLWPQMRRLIAERRPAICFGEQVASRDGRDWLAGVRVDLEKLGYAVGGADLCAAGIKAPQRRQRLWWLASAMRAKRRRRPAPFTEAGVLFHLAECRATGCMASAGQLASRQYRPRESAQANGAQGFPETDDESGRYCAASAMVDTSVEFSGPGGQNHSTDGNEWAVDLRGASISVGRANGQRRPEHFGRPRPGNESHAADSMSRLLSPWENFEVIHCLDDKSRRIEPGTFPLADGLPGRVGRIRGYGNAIVAQLAAVFIRSYLETE